jgi:septal ring factor EnvC (AmiA/AmiB activator)
LRERLARGFGAEADTANGRATSPLIDQLQQQAADLEADNAQLRQDAVKLKGDLREANETLDAARAMNRELMAEINRPGQREAAPPAPTTSRPQRSRRSPSPV